MPRPFPYLQPGDTPARAVRRWFTGTFAGRALALGAAVKIVAFALQFVPAPAGAVDVVDAAGGLALVAGAVALVYRLYTELKSLLLWRVRRKLTLSYLFIGFVPALLILVLCCTAGIVLLYNVSQYVARDGIESAVDQAAFMAESAAFGLQSAPTIDELRQRLERRQSGAARVYPFASYAVVPAHRRCAAARSKSGEAVVESVMATGAWRHLDPPGTIPDSIGCEGFKALVAYSEAPLPVGEAGEVSSHLVARAVAWPDELEPRFAVVVDLPFSTAVLDGVRDETGIDVGRMTASPREDACRVLHGRTFEPQPAVRPAPASLNPLRQQFEWVLFLEFRDWATPEQCKVSVKIGMTAAGLYDHISSKVATQGKGKVVDIAAWLVNLLAILGVLFLVIQIAAFIMGLSLARSITGSVHELFTGTERVRLGDFTHKIAIRSRDQLGALAESFNSMTASIEDLLEQKAEKERMEQELRIARNIQMSLLPQGGLAIPGLSVTAHCEPAREVGGDYYDYMWVDDHRVGLLIADVAGKGTSAALYMAELKGLMLSLTQLHTSPRQLLIDANRIISRHLDTRSFITITYAVVDLEARTLTHARAGHCPLIYVPGPYAASRCAQILAPDGLVLGLQIDNGERFERLLVEATIPFGAGDLFLFYTDGLTDAMDADGESFGDARLAALVQERADLPFEELRERILREIANFSGPTPRQDDMTMLLLKVDDDGGALRGSHA